LLFVVDDRVVERAVRFDVAHFSPADLGESSEGTDLVDHVVGELDGSDVDEPPPEPGQVPVAHLGADRDIALGRLLAGPPDDRRVSSVESAGDVRTGDYAEQGFVIAELPAPEPFRQIRVEIHVALTSTARQ